MEITALQAHGEGLGADVGEYRGATTAARFGDPQAEFARLRSGCGVYDLGFRAKISLTGADRVRWLNGMVTNNIRDLARDHGAYAFLLNPQGHILGDLYAYNRGESITVDTDSGLTEKILATFDHYIIMDDVEVTNLSQRMTALGIAGPKSREVLAAAAFAISDLQALQVQSVMWQGTECTLVRGDDAEAGSYEIWLAPASVRQLWDALVASGAAPVGSEALELHRIVSGMPRYGVDIRERDLPQETEQERALNFNKGCYVGQEIVERIRSRGAVHRKFTGFLADGAVEIAPGNKIVAGEKEVGEITSAASLHLAGGEKTVALGYIRREVGIPGREVTIASAKATVVQLPVRDGGLVQEARSMEQRPASRDREERRETDAPFKERLMAEKKHEQSGFKVTDRRLFTADGELRGETAEEVETARPTPAAVPQAATSPEKVQAPAAADTVEADREMPTPPTSAEQEAQAAAYKQSSKDLDTQVELSGHSAKDFEITLERFLASLYMTAMMQLGLMRQQGGQPQVDIIGARQTIDTLSLLAEKTKGNLTPAEENFLQNSLYELRMAYVEVTNALARPPQAGPATGTIGR